MKIAITGKGGVGKTTIAAALASILSKDYKVFAIDADPDMNLASALGIHSQITPISMMKELIKQRTGVEPRSSFGEILTFGQVFKLNPKIDDLPESLCVKYDDEDKLKILVMGTVDKGGEGCVCPASVLLRALLRHITLNYNEIIILDMEAGIEHLGRKTAESVDLMIIVVEPSLKSVETAKRIRKLAVDIGIRKIACIINKVSKNEEIFLRKKLENLGFKIIGTIPKDRMVVKADMEGKPLVSYGDSKALKVIEKIAQIFY